jgi:crotonobetainyl-CoA:carnitine CoA-transferase CaiB-like acyl-CoA transferase
LLKALKKKGFKTLRDDTAAMVTKKTRSNPERMPLEGIRVADFTWVQAGPWVGRYFANYGAEVIRVESATKVDWARNVPGGDKAVDGKLRRGSLFTNFNCDKLGITLNLKNPKGIEIAKRLISISDVVCDNFSAGYMEKIGLGYDELVKIKPDIIMLSMPVFGNTGPRKRFAGYGTGIQAAVGLSSLSGFPNRPPGVNIALTDMGPNPTHATIALLAALHYRNRTGKGQYIEEAQFESSLCWMETMVLGYTVNNRVQSQQGNRLSYAAPHGVYRCKGDDRWCAIAVFTERQWQALCDVINLPWTGEDRFSTLLRRKENEDELDRLLEMWTLTKSAEEVMKLMQAKKVPAGVVETGKDILTFDEQIRSRKYYIELDHPDGRAFCENIAIKFSETPGKVRHPGPATPGQDNEYVFRQILGMNEDEINQGYIEGAFD